MASRYWVGGTANWDNTAGTKWATTSGGAGGASVPTSSDDVFFDAASGAITCTQTVGISFLSINFTGFTGTFASSGATTISANGNITFAAGMTITSTANLSVNATSTITSNGKTWTGNFNIGATVTITLADNFTVASFTNNGSLCLLNGNNLNVLGSITITQQTSTGSTIINLTGTGTWSGSATLRNNLTINTSGTITISGTITYNTGTLTYTAGTVVTTGTTVTINGSCTLATNGIIWNNVTNFSTTAITLTSDLYCSGTFRTQTSAGTINGFNIYCLGNLLVDTGNISGGTTNVILNGTGIWSGTGTFRNNITIKSTASIVINGAIAYNTGTFIVEAGAQVNASNSVLVVQATATTTFDISSIKLNNFYLGGVSTVNTLQLNSPLYITGTAYLGASSQPQTINGSPIYIESGTLSSQAGNAGTISGTSQIIMTGDKATYLDSATPVYNGQGTWRIPITIDIRGTFLMYGRLVFSTGGSLNIQNGTVDHRDGIVNRTSLIIQANTTLINIDKCKFKNITVTAGVTITMNKFFSGSPEFKTVIRSTIATTNYNIMFTDTIPKKAFFVNIRNCTVNQTLVKNQLNIIGRDANAGFNTGILFGDNGREGFPLNQFPTEPSYSFGNGFQVGGMNN